MPLSYEDPIDTIINIHNPPEGVYPIGFKLYYTDETVYTGIDNLVEAWEAAPNTGIQVLVIYESYTSATGYHTRHMMHGLDYYSYDGDTFYASNDSRATPGTILYGEWTTDEQFEELRQRAFNNYDL